MTFLLDTNVVSEWVKPRPNPNVMRWLADVDEEFYSILVDRGLCEPRQSAETVSPPDAVKLGEFLTAYTSRRTDVKPNTLTVWGHTRRCLVEYFGPDHPMTDITVGDAEDWRRWLARCRVSTTASICTISTSPRPRRCSARR